MPKVFTGANVYETAKERIRAEMLAGNHIVVSISGGKDSTVVMELSLEVARELGMLPLDCIMRDEEIMYPGTFEYLERVKDRPEINLHWVIAGQPIINAYNRFMPYFWVFDPAAQDRWIRTPPAWGTWIPEQSIDGMTTTTRFPVEPGKRLVATIGLRAQESLTRLSRISATEGAMTKHPTAYGAYTFAPIYDWSDDDVWRYIREFKLDYNTAYNKLFQVGVPRRSLRIAPPSMKQGMDTLKYALRLWPKWFDAVDARLPGIRQAARYGRRALKPYLLPGETWEDVYNRSRSEAEEYGAYWLVKRIDMARKVQLSEHANHASTPLPMTNREGCKQCLPKNPGSWQRLAETMYNGDPWSHGNQHIPYLEPPELREDAKYWFADGKKGKLHW